MNLQINYSDISSISYENTNNNSTNNLSKNSNDINKTINKIKEDIEHGYDIVKENIEHGYRDPTSNIEDFKKILKLLDRDIIDKSKLNITDEFDDGLLASAMCDGSNNIGYTVTYKDIKLFTITITESETRFPEKYTSGEDFNVEFYPEFNNIYIKKLKVD